MKPNWTINIALSGALSIGSAHAFPLQNEDLPQGSHRTHWINGHPDGLVDLYVILPGDLDVYLRNGGDGRFVDATSEVGLDGLRSLAVAHADFDRDGFVDLARAGEDGALYVHRGNDHGVYEDATDELGFSTREARSVSWADLDGDGLLDLQVATPNEDLKLYRNLAGVAFEMLELPSFGGQGVTSAGTANLAGDDADIENAERTPRSDAAGRGETSVDLTDQFGRTEVKPTTNASLPGGTLPLAACLQTIMDQGAGGCLMASSVPTLGALYPLSDDFSISPTSGFVGLGASTPTHRLQVVGSIRADDSVLAGCGGPMAPGFRFGNGTEGSGFSSPATETIVVSTNGAERMRFQSNGRIGIGTGSLDAGELFHLRDTGNVGILLDADSNNSGNQRPIVRMQQNDGAVAVNLSIGGSSNSFLLDSPDGFDQHFRIFDNSASANDWEFQNFTDIEARITDLGNLQLDGSVSSPATDLAEYYPLAEIVEPGDVVAFQGEGLALVRADDSARVRLAGIVSSNPGLQLGISGTDEDSTAVAEPVISDSERFLGTDPEFKIDRLVMHQIEVNTRAPLALTGRVPCKVSAENGPIRPGDLLTVSTTPGYAMKATEAGPVIGTALQSFAHGEGKIVVLANLGWFSPGQAAEVSALQDEVLALRSDLDALAKRFDGTPVSDR